MRLNFYIIRESISWLRLTGIIQQLPHAKTMGPIVDDGSILHQSEDITRIIHIAAA